MTHVAIIGAGPVGLTLANLLARRGVQVTVLEGRAKRYPLPRAIHFDGETMRVFQAAGVAEAILPHTHPGVGMLFKNVAGDVLVDWSRDSDVGPMGWRESYRFFQPGVESVLEQALAAYDHANIRRGVAVMAVDQGRATLADGDYVEADFIVGCEGASSLTRRAIGADMLDLGFQERWLVVDLCVTRARPDLGDHSIQFCDADAPATYVRGAGEWRRWEMRLCADDPDDITPAEVWRRLSRWITPQDATLQRAAVYTFRSALASRWRSGALFIAGDAAHQMPPFMGQGMCAGLRDVANLAWKLAAATGPHDPMLDSYETERAPHVRAFIDMTMQLGRLINQTAAGAVPSGRMSTIQPPLGAGVGRRDAVAGHLAPQVRHPELSDDMARGGFYALVRDHCVLPLPLPCFGGAEDWLASANLFGVIVRPDGYALAGARTADDLRLACSQVPALSKWVN